MITSLHYRFVLTAALAAAFSLQTAAASVITYAQTAAGANGASGGYGQGNGDASGSGPIASYAVASGDASGIFSTGSGSLFLSGCAPCSPSTISEAAVTATGSTGAAKAFVGAGLVSSFGGESFARVTLDDVITFDTASVSFTLDTFYQAFFSGRPSLIAGLFYSSSAFHQVYFSLQSQSEEDGLDLLYSAFIELNDSWVNLPGPADGRGYSFCGGAGGSCTPIVGTQFPSADGHFSFSDTIDVSDFVGQPLVLTYQVQSSATCEYSLATGSCTSIADSWNTSYLGFQSLYSSANGYSYLGAPAVGAVPEPSTVSLLGLAGLAVVIERLRRRSKRAHPWDHVRGRVCTFDRAADPSLAPPTPSTSKFRKRVS